MTKVSFYPEPTYRAEIGLTEVRLQNLYMEKAPQGPGEVALVSRGGLAKRVAVGGGPVRGVFRQPGAATGGVGSAQDGIFIVSGGYWFKRKARLMAVSNLANAPVRMAASDTQVVLVSDKTAYCYQGGAATEITDADLPDVSDVKRLGERFFYLQYDSGVVWFSAIGDATDIDGLNFFTAESEPDSIVGMEVLNGDLVLFGENSIEPYYQTADPDAPVQRRPGATIGKGCAGRDTIVALDNTLFWVGSDKIVYKLEGYTAKKVSTAYFVDEKLARATDLSEATAYALYDRGHAFYVLNLPNVGTLAYDVSTGLWTEFTSAPPNPQLRISCGALYDGEMWLGDYQTGRLWGIRQDVYQDSDEPITRICSAGVEVEDGRPACHSVALECVRGFGLARGKYSDPVVELRYSDDGFSFNEWKKQKLGVAGAYSEKAVWRKCGIMGPPGRLFEIRASAAVPMAFRFLKLDVKWP